MVVQQLDAPSPKRRSPLRDQFTEELRALLAEPMLGAVDATAYDTAWVARVPDRDDDGRPAFPSALDWLLANQRPDGSWGASLEYHHDRLQSTLRAALSLAYWQRRQGHRRWTERIEVARKATLRHAVLLSRDPYETIGFELVFPTLLAEARELGLSLPLDAFDAVHQMRADKLASIPANLIYTPRTTLAFSAEFLGAQMNAAKMAPVLDAQGSLGCSPSATACYLTVNPSDRAAHAYLARVLAGGDGGASAFAPIDIYERAWVLYNAMLIWPDASAIAPAIAPVVASLRREMERKGGAAPSEHFPLTDLDDTAMVARILMWAGVPCELDLIKPFEEATHFRCYAHERNPSISGHVHLVELLTHLSPSGEQARMLDKAVRYLDGARTDGTFWFDKWHASPYYTTGHAIIALGDRPELSEGATRWIERTQRPDGSWGHYGKGTAEETAYCVQALAFQRRLGHPVDAGAVERGAAFLDRSSERRSQAYTPLWIGKTLYTPPVVVHSTVLGALALVEQFEGGGLPC